ncbi:MAG: hypothetical protein K9G11_02980 [Rickettsiaceae bacterium]|nr:hypothetical protein [Rickettsiaceae bacterium]
MPIYEINESRLNILSEQDLAKLKQKNDIVWIDLNSSETAVSNELEEFLDLKSLAGDYTNAKLISKSFVEKAGQIFMTSGFFFAGNYKIKLINFIIKNEKLITIREDSYNILENDFTFSSVHHARNDKAIEVLLGIVKNNLARILEVIEVESNNLNDLNNCIVTHCYDKMNLGTKEALKKLGMAGTILSRIEESLASTRRMISFLSHTELLENNNIMRNKLSIILQDIIALSEQANFLTNKVAFLLDATLGLINIEQNVTMKTFSVLSVIFMPPTLVATIYGMNFKSMPELNWGFGYPFSILVMIISSSILVYYFKKKKWW